MAKENIVAISARFEQELLNNEIDEVIFIPSVNVAGHSPGVPCSRHGAMEYSAKPYERLSNGRLTMVGSLFADRCLVEGCPTSISVSPAVGDELRRLLKAAKPMTIDEALSVRED
jgi:hypothetical protein